jgi:hypothetical protein
MKKNTIIILLLSVLPQIAYGMMGGMSTYAQEAREQAIATLTENEQATTSTVVSAPITPTSPQAAAQTVLQPTSNPLPSIYRSDIAGNLRAMVESKETEKKELQKVVDSAEPVTYPFSGKIITQIPLTESKVQPSKDNTTCGPRVLLIMKAINTLIDEGKEITGANLEEALGDNHDKIVKACQDKGHDFSLYNRLCSPLILSFLNDNDIKLDNLFVLGNQGKFVLPTNIFNKNSEEYAPMQKDDISHPVKANNDLLELATQLNNNELKYPIYFMCTDEESTHWTLIFVMKKKSDDSDPMIGYIDPKNTKFSQYGYADKCVRYVINPLFLKTANPTEPEISEQIAKLKQIIKTLETDKNSKKNWNDNREQTLKEQKLALQALETQKKEALQVQEKEALPDQELGLAEKIDLLRAERKRIETNYYQNQKAWTWYGARLYTQVEKECLRNIAASLETLKKEHRKKKE